MKKIMALFLVVVMCLCVFAGCDEDKPNKGETSPLATLPERTEPPKTETELALDDALADVGTDKVVYSSITVSSEAGSVSVTPTTSLEEIRGAIPVNSDDASVIELVDPDIVGVKERLSFKKVINQEAYKGYYWSFVADSSEADGSLKWLELDPLANYDGSKTIAINDVNLSMVFTDVVTKWGTPDYAGVELLNGEESVVLRWDYEMGMEESHVCVYVCFVVPDGVGIPETPIYNIYINPQFPNEG